MRRSSMLIEFDVIAFA